MKFRLLSILCLEFMPIFGLKNTSPEMDKIYDLCKKADANTLVIIEAENIIQSYLSTLFMYENDSDVKQIYDDFLERRKKLPTEQNEKIELSLLNAPRTMIENRIKYIIQEAREKSGTKFIILFNKSNKFICNNKISNIIAEGLQHTLGNFGQDWEKYSFKNFKNGILITSKQEAINDLVPIIEKAHSEKPIKKIFVISAYDHNSSDLPGKFRVEFLKLPPSNKLPAKLSLELLKKQLQLLEESHTFYSDQEITELSKQSPQEILYGQCKKLILDVCLCKEIDEITLYNQLYHLLKGTEFEKYILETIEDFQEINLSILPILYFVGNRFFYNICRSLDIKTIDKIVEKSENSNSTGFKFDRNLLRGVPFKVLRNIGCRIHWKDLEKYNWLNEQLSNAKKELISACPDAQRRNHYREIIKIVAKSREINKVVEQSKKDFIKIMEESGLDKEKLKELKTRLNMK